jgi:hypothetical protein
VTESEWLAANVPGRMPRFSIGRASDRELCLIAAACCRRIWPLLQENSRRAVEAAESAGKWLTVGMPPGISLRPKSSSLARAPVPNPLRNRKCSWRPALGCGPRRMETAGCYEHSRPNDAASPKSPHRMCR